MGTASLVLGIIGICTSFIPVVNNVSFILALIGALLAIVALIIKKGKGIAIAGLIVCVITGVVVLQSQKSLSDSIDNTVDTMTGGKTEEILEKYADVNIGEFKVTEGEYTTETELPVTVKNKSSESKTFSVQIEAVKADGSRITTDTVYADSLNAGQSQDFKAFQFLSSDMLEEIKTATFKIVEVSMY